MNSGWKNYSEKACTFFELNVTPITFSTGKGECGSYLPILGGKLFSDLFCYHPLKLFLFMNNLIWDSFQPPTCKICGAKSLNF